MIHRKSKNPINDDIKLYFYNYKEHLIHSKNGNIAIMNNDWADELLRRTFSVFYFQVRHLDSLENIYKM